MLSIQDKYVISEIKKLILKYENRVNNWNEARHPRDNKGKFTKNPKYDKVKNRPRKSIQLPKEEYAQVIHELNTNLTKEQRKKKKITRYIGNNIYTVENNGFNDYKITGKYEIDT